MELQVSSKSVNVHLCCCAYQHHTDLHTANQTLPCPSDSSFPDLIINIYDLHSDKIPHPDPRLFLICLLHSLRNFSNREALV